MTEAVQRRQSILRLEMDQKDIRDYTLDHVSFRVPGWLQAPGELQQAQIGLLRRAIQAIDAMKLLMERRETRYYALCSEDLEVQYGVHKTSIDRLLQWKLDWNAENPTLAPTDKIPRDGLHFHLDPISYATFTLNYIDQVEAFMAGPYSTWTKYKSQVQHMASRIMGDLDYLAWRHWWDNTFLQAMWKWESCLEGLIIPSWEEVVDEIYLLVLERVEDATELANCLCSSRTTSQVNTPHVENTRGEYF